jgi:hypothetical protein
LSGHIIDKLHFGFNVLSDSPVHIFDCIGARRILVSNMANSFIRQLADLPFHVCLLQLLGFPDYSEPLITQRSPHPVATHRSTLRSSCCHSPFTLSHSPLASPFATQYQPFTELWSHLGILPIKVGHISIFKSENQHFLRILRT